MTDREGMIDEIAEALSDRCDMDVSWTEYARAVVERLEKNGVFHEWQPIETAPPMKIILLFGVTDRDGDTILNWRMGTGSKDHEGRWSWNGYNVKIWDHQPTHWQWLPTPPLP